MAVDAPVMTYFIRAGVSLSCRTHVNIAEIELSAMTNQCLNRRIDSLDKLNREVRAWQHERNRNQKTVKWQFTTDDARIKLHSLYPAI
jgi:hypothetical protein